MDLLVVGIPRKVKITMMKLLSASFLLLSLPTFTLAQYNPDLCAGFVALEFSFPNFDRYPEWFDDNSTLTLAQAGEYKGAADIVEYVRFANIDSPYVNDAMLVNLTSSISGFDPMTGICKFSLVEASWYILNPEVTGGQSFTVGVMGNFYYSIPNNNLAKVDVYYTTAFLEFFFATALNTDKTRGFVCDIMETTGCQDIYQLNGNQTKEECIESLNNLTTADGELVYFDGKSQGCRSLHAVFAGTNPSHCPHVSFEPTPDVSGMIKCQTSQEISVESMFSLEEIRFFTNWCSQVEELGSPTCFNLWPEDNTTETMAPTMAPTGPATDPPTKMPATDMPSEESVPTASPTSTGNVVRGASSHALVATIVLLFANGLWF